MKTEKPREHSELVGSLASAIHKNMNREIRQAVHRLAALEKELARLERSGRVTRFLAFTLAAGAVLLSLVLFHLISR